MLTLRSLRPHGMIVNLSHHWPAFLNYLVSNYGVTLPCVLQLLSAAGWRRQKIPPSQKLLAKIENISTSFFYSN
jgi:hypothetical protein